MRRIRTARRAARRLGDSAAPRLGDSAAPPQVEIRVRPQGLPAPVPVSLVRRIVRTVLSGEGRIAKSPNRRIGEVSVTFLSRPAMQRLNHDWLGHDRPTDVISFALSRPDGRVVGDVYICPAEARAETRRRGIALREEIVRLVVHGLLHIHGYDHPEGPARTDSPMWRRQERYVTVLA